MKDLKIMKFTPTLIVLAASVALVACGSKPKQQAAKAAECVFPDSPRDEAPMWICDAPVEGVAVSAVGSAAKSGAGVAFMRDMAAADGRVKLAQQMRVQVTNMIKQYAETTGAGSSETVDKVNTSVSKLITNETLAGSKVFRSITSPSGGVFVLMGLDPTLAKQQAEGALQTSMKNDRALWQQFKGSQAQSELAADIYKMSEQRK